MMAGQWYNAMDYSMLKMRQENNKKTEAYSRIAINTLSYKDRKQKLLLKNLVKMLISYHRLLVIMVVM